MLIAPAIVWRAWAFVENYLTLARKEKNSVIRNDEATSIIIKLAR